MTNEAGSDVSEIIINLVNVAEDGLGIADIQQSLKHRLHGKSPVDRRLAELVEKGVIVRTGGAWAIKYWSPNKTPKPDSAADAKPAIPISREAMAVQEYVRRPLQARKPIGYQRDFLEDYIPNHQKPA